MTDIVEAVEQEDDPWNEVARDCAEVAVRSDQRTTDRPEITSTPRNIERTLCCLAGHPQDLDPQPRADLRHSRERDRRGDRHVALLPILFPVPAAPAEATRAETQIDGVRPQGLTR